MLKYFTVILKGKGVTRTVAPLDAYTLVDVQVCRRDAGGLSDATAYPAFGSLGTIGISIDGTEVLPDTFPLRWLSQVLYANEYRKPDRRLALNCWGAGSRIEIALSLPQGKEIEYVAIFRYEDAPTEFLGIPYRYHVARRTLSDLLAEGSPMHFANLQREALMGAATAVAVDWDIPSLKGNDLTADFAQQGRIAVSLQQDENSMGEAGRLRKAMEAHSILDRLMVRVGSTSAGYVEVPLGVVRPSLLQSLEDSLVLLPPRFEETVTVEVMLPQAVSQRVAAGDGFMDEAVEVAFTSVIIERVKERSRK